MASRRGAKWTDVAACAAVALLGGTFTIAQIAQQTEIANRVKCAANLRQIGQAMLLYANENRGAYPRAKLNMDKPAPVWGTPYKNNAKLGAEPAAKVDPFAEKKSDVAVEANDVSAALYLLIRTEDITSEVFVCPSTGAEKWDFGGGANNALNWSNFPGDKVLGAHLDYSYQNPYPSKESVGKGFKLNSAISSEFAVAADMNPGVDALKTVVMNAKGEDLRKINSPNHSFDGENVLYGDGHVSFECSPFVGIKRDNIYTFGDTGSDHVDRAGDGIVGPSVGPDDSVLLPTAKDLGIVDAEGKLSDARAKWREGVSGDLKPGTPAEQDAIVQKLIGMYTGQVAGGQNVKLELTKDKLIGRSGPITITFDYKIIGLGTDLARVELTAPDTKATTASIRLVENGLVIKGSPYLEGKWAKQ